MLLPATVAANAPALLVAIVIAGLLIQLGAEIVRMSHTQLQVHMGQRVVYNLRATLLTHLQALPLRHHVLARTADSVYRLDADAHCVDDLIIGGLFPLTLATLNLGVMFVVAPLHRPDARAALPDGGTVPLTCLCGITPAR